MSKSDEVPRKSLLALKGAGPLGCAMCHTQFPTPEERIQHARDKHNVHKSKFPCTACNLSGFSSLFHLQNHIRTKCLGVGWETLLFNADLSSSASNDEKVLILSEETLKCNRSKSPPIDSSESNTLKQTRRPSLRSSKPGKPDNGGVNTQEINEASVLTATDESVTVDGSLPPRKRKISATVEKSAKIPRKELKSVKHLPQDIADRLETIATEIIESIHNDETPMRKTRRNSSSDIKPEAPMLMKLRKTANLTDENGIKNTADKISSHILRTEPEQSDTDVERAQVKIGTSNFTPISEIPKSESLDKTLPLRKRRISAKILKKELKSEETNGRANEEELKPAIESTLPDIASTVQSENLEHVHISETPTMNKTRSNCSSKIDPGFSSLPPQNYKKSPKDVQESGNKSTFDSLIASHASEPSVDDVFSSSKRSVSAKIPKRSSKLIELGSVSYAGLENEQEKESESELPISEFIIAKGDNHDKFRVSEHAAHMKKTRRTCSGDFTSDASKVTSQNSEKFRTTSSDLSESTVESVVPSDKRGVLPLNDLSEINDGAKPLNKALSTSRDKPSAGVSKSSFHSDFAISGSGKTVTKRRLSQIRSEKDDLPSDVPSRKNHFSRAPKSAARTTSKTKKLTEYFKDYTQKGFKKIYSLDCAGESPDSLCGDNAAPKNALKDGRLETIVEEKTDSQNSPKENKSNPVFKNPLELLTQADFILTDSKMKASYGQTHGPLKLSKELQESKSEDISKVTEESNEIYTRKKDVELAAARGSTPDFKKKKDLKVSEKRRRTAVKSPQNSLTRTLKLKTFTSVSKGKEPTTPEPVDTLLDAKRLELKRLRESLGLDFSHTPISVTSSASSNTSGSPALGSPQTPKALLGGVNLLKSSRSSSNPSTPTAAIMPKTAEKFALLDWDSFITKASRKSRPPTVQTETIKKRIKEVVSPNVSLVPNVEEKSATESLKEAGNSLAAAEKTTVSTTPESPSKLQNHEEEFSNGANISAANDSPLSFEEPSSISKSDTAEKSKSGLQKRNPIYIEVSVEDTSINSETQVSTDSKIPEHIKEIRMEVGSNLTIQNREGDGSPLDSKELDESHDVIKDDDGASESTVPCNGGSMVSDSDRESSQNDKMSMLSCPVCHLGGFATKAELKVHLTISCREEEPQKKKVVKRKKRPIEWYCPGCPRSFGPFESAKALLDHLPTCHIKRAAFFNGEGKSGKGKGRNFQIDPKDLPFWPAPLPSTPVTYGCPVCGCFFATASRLDQHRSETDHFHVVGRFLKTNEHFKSSK